MASAWYHQKSHTRYILLALPYLGIEIQSVHVSMGLCIQCMSTDAHVLMRCHYNKPKLKKESLLIILPSTYKSFYTPLLAFPDICGFNFLKKFFLCASSFSNFQPSVLSLFTKHSRYACTQQCLGPGSELGIRAASPKTHTLNSRRDKDTELNNTKSF